MTWQEPRDEIEDLKAQLAEKDAELDVGKLRCVLNGEAMSLDEAVEKLRGTVCVQDAARIAALEAQQKTESDAERVTWDKLVAAEARAESAEAQVREREAGEAAAMALVLNHEGHIGRLESSLRTYIQAHELALTRCESAETALLEVTDRANYNAVLASQAIEDRNTAETALAVAREARTATMIVASKLLEELHIGVPTTVDDAIQRAIEALAAARAENERHRAEFLWPAEDGSIESLGYEFANAKTEEYRREMWDALVAALRARPDDGRVDRIVAYCQAIVDGHASEIGLARAIVEGYGTPEFAAADGEVKS